MITVHHLENSRSQRLVWLLEELGLEYEIKNYDRDPQTKLAPPELKAVHPLGKAPVIEFEGRTIAESGAAIQLLLEEYDSQHLFSPERSSAAWPGYIEWLHYVEGSAMLPLMLAMYAGRLGPAAAPLMPRIQGEMKNNFDYIAGALGDRQFLVGDELTGADVQIWFVLDAAAGSGALETYPTLKAYHARLMERPAFKRSIEKGGAYDLAKLRA